MTLIVACPNCQTRYNLPDKFQGKKVKCKSCSKPFAAGVGAKRAPAGRVNQEAQRAPQVDPQELANMGIGALRAQPDPFAAPAHQGPDPLRNHVVQDPGFEASVVPGMHPGMPSHTDDAEEDPNAEFQSVVANPYVTPAARPKAQRDRNSASDGGGKRKRRKRAAWSKQPWFLLTVIFVPLFLLSILFSATGIAGSGAAVAIAFGTFGLFGLATMVMGFWGLFLAHEIGGVVQVLLCWLVPFYILYFIVKHWDHMKDYAFATIAAILLSPLGVVALILAGVGAAETA